MSRNRGKRYDDTPRHLNLKKVFATIIAIIVIIMIVVSLKRILTSNDKTKEVSSLTTYIAVFENNKWGVIDNKGNEIISIAYDEMIVIPDKNEDVFVCTYDADYENETYKTKILNNKGEEILTKYEGLEPIENTDGSTIWYESDVLKFSKNGKYGLIDFSGKVLVDAEYDNIYALDGIEKSIIIEKDGYKGLFNNNTNEIIINPEYIDITSISDTYENGFIVKTSDNKYGVIAADKTKVLDTKYDEVKKITENNYYVVVENSKVEIVDASRKVILDSGFDSVEAIQSDNFIILKNGKYGVINKNGEEVVNASYENLSFGTTDSYIAQKDGSYGIINKNEDVEVDFTYDNIYYIKSGNFYEAERTDLTTDVIDSNYNIVLEGVIISELNIDNGYLRVREDQDYKYYNFKFEEKTSREILSTNTLFLVKENGKYGYENKNGERIVDCIYDDAKEQNEFGYCAVKSDGLWGALKSDGTVIVEPSRNLDDYLYVDFISTYNRYNDLSIYAYTK